MYKTVKKIKQLNRKRNIATKKIKFRLRLIAADSHFRRQTTLNVSQVNSILIIMVGKGIGDAIVMTGLVKSLAEAGYSVSLLTEPRISHIFADLPFISKNFVFRRDKSDVIIFNTIRALNYDLLIDLDDVDKHSPLRVKIIKKCAPAHTIGVNQFLTIYDTSLKHRPLNAHFSSRHVVIANLLGCPIKKLTYFVNQSPAAESDVLQLIKNHHASPLIVINPYGTEEARNMSVRQIDALCSAIQLAFNTTPFIIGVQAQIERIPDADNHVKMRLPLFSHAVALVSLADLVISTDTSIVHLCNALNKNLVCLYHNKIQPTGEDNNILWGPDYPNARQVLSPATRIDEIEVDAIFAAVKTFLSS